MDDAKKAISRERCSVHGKGPEKITVSGDKLRFECCCDQFQKKLEGVMEKALAESIEKQLKNMFK